MSAVFEITQLPLMNVGFWSTAGVTAAPIINYSSFAVWNLILVWPELQPSDAERRQSSVGRKGEGSSKLKLFLPVR